MTDNPFDPFAKRAAELAQEAFDAGYQAGYRAAIDTVMRAAQTASSRGAAVGPLAVSVDARIAHEVTASMSGEAVTSVETTIPKTASGRAAPGSIKNLVRDFVLTAGKPVSEAEFAAKYPNVIRPSRYMAFRSLGEERVIVKQGKAWVPAQSGAGTLGVSRAQSILDRAEGGTGHEPA
jgi:hypothetical protein